MFCGGRRVNSCGNTKKTPHDEPADLLENVVGDAIQALEHRADYVPVSANKHGLSRLEAWHHALPPKPPRPRLGVLEGFGVGTAAPRGGDVICGTRHDANDGVTYTELCTGVNGSRITHPRASKPPFKSPSSLGYPTHGIESLLTICPPDGTAGPLGCSV